MPPVWARLLLLVWGLLLSHTSLAESWPLAVPLEEEPQPVLAIVLDDVGYDGRAGERALALSPPITLAFLPHTPHAPRLAHQARQQGHGVLLHAPMANQHAYPLGPGALTPELSKAELQQRLRRALDSLPAVDGVNNHMGSLLTAQAQPMQWVMEVLAERRLLFLDSRTTAATVAAASAERQGLPWLRRDVFLDNEEDERHIRQQLQLAIDLAKRQGYAVAIGHPYSSTLRVLEQELPKLDAQGIRRMGVLQLQRWLSTPTEPQIP